MPSEHDPSVGFQILSHAGLLIKGAGKSLVFDPWLVGSAYWRSWWNYPPVSRELIDSLRPDFIYLTHIHWDHFHGPSLRKFPRETPILIPKSPARRMKKDLIAMGFANVTEIGHGKTLELAPGLRLSSYQFYPFTDSAAVVECGGATFFNANDARVMGGPLRQILDRHPRIDFVFRSHSSVNERMCFDYMDQPSRQREEHGSYLSDFADFARRSGARYAIPFASNHCYLHRETFHLNDTIITPPQVEAYCRTRGGNLPEVVSMVSGDAWSAEGGFAIAAGSWFTDRDRHLDEYASRQADALGESYAVEARTQASLDQVEGYFRGFFRAMPWPVRRLFKDRQVTWVLSGKTVGRFWVDLNRGVVRELAGTDDELHPLQIHTSAYVFRRCVAQSLFTHLGISKRLLFRCRRADAKYIRLLVILFCMYEAEMLPLRKMLAPHFIAAWIPRWREAVLYGVILFRRALGRSFSMGDYLKSGIPRQPEPKRTGIPLFPRPAAHKRI